jgi:uncharacterized protein
MKLHLDKSDQYNTITRYDAHHVRSATPATNPADRDARAHRHRLAPGSFDTLDEAAFAHLAGLGCEILILGTGMRQRFPSPS